MSRSSSCRSLICLSLAALAATVFSPLAAADTTLVDFNGLTGNATNSQVQSYLQAQLTAGGYGGTVTVSGAAGGNGYNGEGHVVGPASGGGVQSLTLGTLDGGNFIMNDKPHGFDQINISFSQPIYSAKFDFEIFPNGDVADGRHVNPQNYPDFTFKALSDKQLATSYHALSVMPGAANPYMTGSPLTNLNSPANSPELAPQLLVTGLGAFEFPNGVNQLQFIDWPPRIGIDNLQLGLTPPSTSSPAQVPEPASLLAFCLALGVLAFSRLRRFGPPTFA